jgi:hypothetical protein
MKLIPDKLIIDSNHKGTRYNQAFTDGVMATYDNSVTITDDGWDEIGLDYRLYSRKLSATYKPFSKYLHELIEMRRAQNGI